MCKRGDIYYVDFGEKDGSKQGGVRPALVVSNNKANKHSPVVTVVPLSARVWKKKYLPTHDADPQAQRSARKAEHGTLAEQVETLDKTRLGERIGEVLDDMVMEQITVALQIQIGAYAEYN
ncbi:MAG: type II toxin-antitoxin system PemK/MazF family toxin [Coprococcus eutactus]